ncbi:glutathione-s-transferase theta, gst [Coniochaeta sp. 2T2.1]|nr:glutathione-s-transferase theta, gst [Coniochaeta sp. 2T2.1]
MSALKPLLLYYRGPSPNPWKVAIILEELGLPWERLSVQNAELKTEPFISLNPNGKVPALEDPNTDIVLWESGAIIDYLIDMYDTQNTLHYTSSPEKYTTRCWEHFQMSGQGPYFGQKNWFSMWHPERLPSAIQRYSDEAVRITSVIDTHLKKKKTQYLVGNKITYADLMFVAYYKIFPTFIAPEVDLSVFPYYTSWINKLVVRPAVVKVETAWEQERRAVLRS